MKILALLACSATLLVTGCSSNCCHKTACGETKLTCAKGHECCLAAKTDCAHCPKCSAH